MSVEALKQYTLRAKYARYNKQAKRRETYQEANDRVRNMMLELYPQVEEEINWAYDLVDAERILGSQRALQFGGRPALQHNARVYNCTSSYCDRLRFFQEAFYLLLCGCGTGFSVQKHHIAKLPKFNNVDLFGPSEKTFVVPDTIEGWADALGVLLSAYFEDPLFPEYYGRYVEFDYSLIRPEGAYLSSGAGKAPGPEPLRRSLEKIRQLLDECIGRGQERLRPIDAYDIVMHASDAVLAGGVRRSATICVFSLDDLEMMTAKTGNWYVENPQRGRSNNSVLLIRNQTTREQFRDIIKHVREWGEPGFYWSDSTEQLPNPCQPTWAKVMTPYGIRTIGEVKVGDEIWSETGWTKIVKKWSTGINKVYKYETTAGVFYGTKGHRVVSDGQKVEVGQAEAIDVLSGPDGTTYKHQSAQEIVDGLVLGDGTSDRKVVLLVGKDDQDYFTSEIRSFIGEKSSTSYYAYNVETTVTPSEIPLTYLRRVPERFIRGNKATVCNFLRGLFSAKGSVCEQRVTLKSASKGLIEDVQLMLSSVGIRSYFTTNQPKTINFENGPYECRESYDLNVTTDRCKFRDFIGFLQQHKREKLDDMIAGISKTVPGKKTYDIISITEISEEETFDMTVDNETHTYWTQGLNVSNCVEIGFWPSLLVEATAASTRELLKHYKGPIGTDGASLGAAYGTNNTLALSGWQFCNLSTINGQLCKTPEEFYTNCIGAATVGTLQAAMTSFPYLGPVTEAIVRREALLGVSITGVMDSPKILLDPEILRNGARHVLETNERLAKKLGINVCARGTCLKPEGTSSCLLGTASGAGPWKFKRGFRRVQANRNEVIAKFFEEVNPWAVEKSKWCANGTTNVLTFCLEAPVGAIIEGDMTAVEYLDVVRLLQDNWVKPGKRTEHCTQPWLTNNVSNTVTVKPHEWDDVVEHIYKHRESYAGISLLAASGDKDYVQAPFTAVYYQEEIEATYGWDATMAARSLLVTALDLYDNDIDDACNDILSKKTVWNNLKSRFVESCQGFANIFFSDDTKKLTYLLKDLDNLRRWNYLKEMYQQVDYNQLIEESDDTTPQAEIACSGGACQLV